jgi:ketosteroid isomerase-like protein
MNPMEIVTEYFEAFKNGETDRALALPDQNAVWNVAGVPNVSTVIISGNCRRNTE